MTCSASLKFGLGLGSRELTQSILQARDMGLRAWGSELRARRTGGVSEGRRT